jgi:hypothetical protein
MHYRDVNFVAGPPHLAGGSRRGVCAPCSKLFAKVESPDVGWCTAHYAYNMDKKQ